MAIDKYCPNSISQMTRDSNLFTSCLESLELKGLVSLVSRDKISKPNFVSFARLFGEPRTVDYLTRDNQYPQINLITKTGERSSVFGDVWHSDHAYEAHPPRFTFLHCETIPPKGGETMFSSNAVSYRNFERKYGREYDDEMIVNSMPVAALTLAKRYSGIECDHSCTKKLVKCVKNKKVFTCNAYHTLYANQISTKLDSNILSDIFNLQASCAATETLNWVPNQIAIWDNELVLHKARNNYGRSTRRTWRILVDI